MKNCWSDREASACVRRYRSEGVNADLALRVYTSRLLGREPKLVLHGGGNTSVKTVMPDVMGNPTEVLCVKGSGWDMGDIEPPGLPAVRLGPLQQMRSLSRLSDEDMVNAQRTNLLDSTSPNPSVETLLHAFLPHKFIDHTHSNAVLALSDQENGDELCRETWGKRFGYVPYIMPGFDLSKKALDVFELDPDVEGLILLKHGIFTFGDTAEQAYSRMIKAVSAAERRIKKSAGARTGAPKAKSRVKTNTKIASVADVAPILRGITTHEGKSLLLEFRSNRPILDYVGGDDLSRYSQEGTVTPDHVIRTKAKPMLVPMPIVGELDKFEKAARSALTAYVRAYHGYFKRGNKRARGAKTELDPMPRVILVPGLGLFGLGNTIKAARVVADLAETAVEVIGNAESIGRYEVIPERDIFDMEYWGLEQAKLGKAAEKSLARKVVVVSGGASGIGAASARAFAVEGATVAILDRDESAVATVAKGVGGIGIGCDVTDPKALRSAFNAVCAAYGGVDIAISNAGAAWQGRIGEVDDDILRQSFELNFWAHQNFARNAVRVMRAQSHGGCLLFNASKQAVNPGKDFGPYGLPKAATLFLMRQYAVDYGSEGIRSNAVNADRIRSGLLTEAMVKSRSSARGLTEQDYLSGNLLGREVLAEDVARAFVDLAQAKATTAAVVTVDGGNIAAAMR